MLFVWFCTSFIGLLWDVVCRKISECRLLYSGSVKSVWGIREPVGLREWLWKL